MYLDCTLHRWMQNYDKFSWLENRWRFWKLWRKKSRQKIWTRLEASYSEADRLLTRNTFFSFNRQTFKTLKKYRWHKRARERRLVTARSLKKLPTAGAGTKAAAGGDKSRCCNIDLIFCQSLKQKIDWSSRKIDTGNVQFGTATFVTVTLIMIGAALTMFRSSACWIRSS